MADDLEDEDYVWHFRLSNGEGLLGSPDQALTEMVRRQLQALLSCVVLTHEGADLKVTGFRFLDAQDEGHALRPNPREGNERPV